MLPSTQPLLHTSCSEKSSHPLGLGSCYRKLVVNHTENLLDVQMINSLAKVFTLLGTLSQGPSCTSVTLIVVLILFCLVTQSCPTLATPWVYNLPSSSVLYFYIALVITTNLLDAYQVLPCIIRTLHIILFHVPNKYEEGATTLMRKHR